MPINLQGSGPIVEGWGPPPQLHAPDIGSLVHAILSSRLGQQKLTQDSISDAIKQMQEQRSGEAFVRGAQQAGIFSPEMDLSGIDPRSAAALASAIAAQTKDTQMDAYHQALADYYNRSPGAGMGGGRGSGTPRYDYHGVLLTGSEYQKRLDQDKRTEEYGRLTNAEAQLNGAAERIAKEWGGVNPDTLEFNNKPTVFRPGNQVKYQQDYAKYLKHIQDATEMKTKRQNYEKWYKGSLQPGATEPGGYPDDEEDGTTPPQTGVTQAGINKGTDQLGPDAQARIQAAGGAPSPTPRPSAPPPADSAAGHAPTYGTPAPGMTPSSSGSGQVGDLVVGQSKRPVGGKMFTWWGDPATGGKGWLPD